MLKHNGLFANYVRQKRGARPLLPPLSAITTVTITTVTITTANITTVTITTITTKKVLFCETSFLVKKSTLGETSFF